MQANRIPRALTIILLVRLPAYQIRQETITTSRVTKQVSQTQLEVEITLTVMRPATLVLLHPTTISPDTMLATRIRPVLQTRLLAIQPAIPTTMVIQVSP